MAGTKGKGGIKFDLEDDDLDYFAGYIKGMQKNINTDAHIGAVVNYAHSILKDEFNIFMDNLARMNPEGYSHVYEWPTVFGNKSETVGNPLYRLWTQELKGQGRNRVATFRFLPSKRPTPVNPILLEPGKSGRTVMEGVHIFYFKATMFEYGLPITVKPEIADYLAFVTNPKSTGKQSKARDTNSNGNITFSKGPVTFIAGGGKFRGMFTNAYLGWWSTMAGDAFDRMVAPRLEKDIREQRFTRIGSKAKPKSMSLKMNTMEQSRGEAAAKMAIKKQTVDYTQGARARREAILNGRNSR